MSQISTSIDAFKTLANFVATGNIAEARNYAKTALDGADALTLKAIADCVHTIENRPTSCADILRAKWCTANEHARPIIEVFGIALSEHPRRPQRAHQPARRIRDTAPRDEHTAMRPEARRTMTADRRAQLGKENRADGLMAAYADRAGVDDARQPTENTYASGLDYDRAAVPDLRGTPCVCCWLERARADHRTGRSDDGLCSECRDKGRPGVPALPEGYSRADVIEARCAFIVAQRPHARALLTQWWKKYATVTDRVVIENWVQRNPLPAQPVDHSAPADERPNEHTNRCAQCGESRRARDIRHRVDDQLCRDCRELEPSPAAATSTSPAEEKATRKTNRCADCGKKRRARDIRHRADDQLCRRCRESELIAA